jgi:hypothetical protein
MSRKQIVIGTITLAVVAIVAVALLLSGNTPAENSNAGTDSPGSTTTSGTTGSTTTTGSATATGTATKPGGSTSSTTTAPGGNGSGTSAPDTNPALSPLRPYPRLPDPGLPARVMTSPAADGEKLAEVAEELESTISALKLGKVPDGSRYQITMRPYGIGPSIALGSRLVIRVSSASPMASAPELDRIGNANVLALADTTHGGDVTTGGTYTAYLTFRSDGSKLIPILSNAELAR